MKISSFALDKVASFALDKVASFAYNTNMRELLVLGSFFLLFFLLPTTNYQLLTINAHSETQIIEMTPDGFKPDPVTVDANSTIIFLNKDKEARWPASNVHPTHELYPEFDPKKVINPGESWPIKNLKVGEWKFHDHIFPHMRGTIKVIAEPGVQQITFPHGVWEYVKEKIKSFVSQTLKIKNLFGQDKQVVLPDTQSFVDSSYKQQEEILNGLADNLGAEKVWEFVKESFKGQSGSSGNIHDLAHLSGSLLFNKNGFEGLSGCSKEFSFGCYHGFLDTAFAKNLDHLQDAYDGCLKLGSATSGPAASCIHGIGHGVASYFSTTDLKKSLSACRKLISGQEYCFDGVFMEFVRSAPESFFKKDDPLYPCNTLEKEFGYAYSFACGRNQPSLLMSRLKFSLEQVVSTCSNSSSARFKEGCIDSVGFSIASTGDTKGIVAGCQLISEISLRVRCLKAAAGELIFQEVPGWEEKSIEVCNSSPARDECLAHLDRLIKEYSRQKKFTFVSLKEDEDFNNYLRGVLQTCYEVDGRDGCYNLVAQVLYNQFGLSQTLQGLKTNEEHMEVYARCHEVTHYLSRFEYEKQKNIAKVYAQCDSTCHGGCYHGTMEAFLKEKNDLGGKNLSQEFAKVCGSESDYQKRLEFNECLHGLGHAAMFVTDMELKNSLALCDNLGEKIHKDRCYSGVFMENSSSSTSFDHQSKYISQDDPFYPCNSLEEKYQELCWQYQSSYFSIISSQDWKKVAALCMQVPKEYQDKCIRTIGTNQVGFTRDLSKMKDDCSLMPSPHFKNICVGGVVSSLSYRFVGDTKKMVDFCNLVDPQNKETCFRQIGMSMLDWDANKNIAIQNCQTISSNEGKDWCLSVI